MKLDLYVWSPHFLNGFYVAWYDSWGKIAWFIDLWRDPEYVFTVIDEGE